MGYRPPLPADALDQQQASVESQTGITVGHEDLRALVVTLDKPHLTRRASSRQRTTASVTNVPAAYNQAPQAGGRVAAEDVPRRGAHRFPQALWNVDRPFLGR